MSSFQSRRLGGAVVGSLWLLAVVGASGCASGGGAGGEGAASDPPAPTISSLTASPDTIDPGAVASLVPTFANGTGAIDHGIGAVASGAAVGTGPLTATTTFTLTVTNTAGARVTRGVTVTVRPAATPGSVTVLRRGTSGALEGVAGVAVHRSAAATGAFLETRVTDAAGVVDFGDVGASHMTLSLVRPAANDAPKAVVSFVAVPVGAVMLRLDRLPGPPDVLAGVSATLSPAGWGAAVQLPSGSFAPTAVPIARQDLQDDGNVTLLGRSGGGESGPLKCGAWRDQPLPAPGANVPIALIASPSALDFDADVPVAVTLAARRKDATFVFEGYGTAPSGSVGWCAEQLPDVDRFAASASAWVETVQTADGYALVDTTKRRRAAVAAPGPALPGGVSFTMPDLTPEALTYAAGTVHATASGSLASEVDLAVARVLAPDLVWHVYARGGDALALPEVPGVSPPAWIDGVDVEAELTAVDGVAGFDALWSEARRLGSFDAALLAHDGTATAATRMTRFTPNHVIGFDGYTWERYGLVTSDIGIHCGASCTGDYRAGTTATLTATPNPGAVFGGWGGDCAAWGSASPVQVLVDRDFWCNPYFGPATGSSYSLSVAIAGGWPALVTSDDGLIKCGDDNLGHHFDQCWAVHDSGYGLTLAATSASLTVVFDVAWRGDCAGTGWSTFLALDGNKSCSVELTPRP